VRVAVFGAGAVGGYFGGRLAQGDHDVVFIARDLNLAALRRQGLRVQSVQGDFEIFPCQATDDPREVGPVDFVLVGVKAWQVPAAAVAIRPLLGEQTAAVPLQNGVEAPHELAETLGEKHVLGGLCTIISLMAEPGVVRHVGGEPYIAFAELDNRPSERVGELRAAFERAGVRVEVPQDIEAALWSKFMLISSFAGVGAVTRSPVGVIRTVPETRAMLEKAMAEIGSVARARGVALSEGAERQAIAILDRLDPASTASMQRDLAEGRLSELQFLSGAVVRMARVAGLETPLHEFIYSALLPSDLAAREKRARL
jgi:2-dehydropantoate 2-reductase